MPSDMFSWPGPDAPITMQSERTGIANKWFAPTGRVVELKVEEDGDLHIALHHATGDKPGVVVCEIPGQPQWCEIRTTVFSWTPTRFPFHTGSAKKPTFGQSPIITVIGKALWDVGHAPKEQNNHRKYMPDYAVWEIHSVMKIEVGSDEVKPVWLCNLYPTRGETPQRDKISCAARSFLDNGKA